MLSHHLQFTRRPPISPPFPYTTLFRSHLVPLDDGALVLLGLDAVVVARAAARDDDVLQIVLRDERAALENIDRKSTRLNSSHSSISYAVFCLKKKSRRSSGRSRTSERS